MELEGVEAARDRDARRAGEVVGDARDVVGWRRA
jgi:hypothetical protein